VKNLRMALVDDVMTTAARCRRQHNAYVPLVRKKIDIWVVARA